MAQRDVDVQSGLSSPNLGASSFVRQGVVDKSGLLAGQGEAAALGVTANAKRTEAVALENMSKIIPGIVETGLEIHKGNALAQLQIEQNKEIDDFLALRQNPELAKTSAENAASLDLASHSLWDKLGQGKATIGDLDANLESFDKETQALRFANDQGVIQPSELQTRLLAITRKHINNNPGLSNELLGHAEKILSLSGISSLRDTKQKLDNAANKAFEDQKNFVLKEASKHNVEIDRFQADDPDYLAEIQEQTNRRKRDKNLFENITEDERVRGIKTTQQADDFWRSKGGALLRGGLATFNQEAAEIIQNNKDNPDVAMQQIRDLESRHIANAASELGGQVSLSSGDGKFHFDLFSNTLRSVVTRLEGAVTLEDRRKIVTNQHGITEKLQEMQLQERFNVPGLRMIGGSELLMGHIIKNPLVQDKIINSMSDIINGSPVTHRIADAMRTSSHTPGVNDAVGISKVLLESGNAEQFNKSVKIFADIARSGQMTNDDFFNFFDSFTDSFSQPFIGKQARDAGTNESITHVFSMGGQYIERIGKALETKTAGQDVKAVEVPGVGIRYVVKGNPSLESELNDKYARRVNRMIKTFANIGGWTNDQAFDQIKNAYVDVLKLDSSSFSRPTTPGEDNLIKKIIGVESSGDPTAKNPDSSATGLGQFIKDTWLSTIKTHFPEFTSGKGDKELLSLRTNPEWSKKVLVKHTEDNRKALSSNKIPTTDTNLYLAHFLGAPTAVKALKANPSSPITTVATAEQIAKNKSILEGKTIGDVIKFAERKMS